VRTVDVCGLVLVAAAAAGCSTYTVQPIPALAAQEATAHVGIASIHVGAQPYQDFDPAQRVFNQSPMENGVLPILLIVENKSEMDIEITRVRVELEAPGGKRLEPLDRFAASGEAAVLAPSDFLWVFPSTDKRAMALDWAIKCVPDLLVCKRGHTVRRFLYYRVGREFAENRTEQCTLVVPFEHADRSKRELVKIPLSIKKRRKKPIKPDEDEFDFDIG
jgi:hypothetical protein